MWRLSGVYQAADSGCRYIQDPLSSWYTHLLRVSGLDVVRALTEEQDATVMTRAEFCADCISTSASLASVRRVHQNEALDAVLMVGTVGWERAGEREVSTESSGLARSVSSRSSLRQTDRQF